MRTTLLPSKKNGCDEPVNFAYNDHSDKLFVCKNNRIAPLQERNLSLDFVFHERIYSSGYRYHTDVEVIVILYGFL